MIEPDVNAPLVEFCGVIPPAPPWFTAAIADAPEWSAIVIDGASIEVLTWGQRGRPGLLFLHGNGAHAGWWDFIAPFFAADYRVAAFSWSGMGGSDHRASYSIAGFIDEIFAVIDAAGLDEAGPPIVVAHSFGGFPVRFGVSKCVRQSQKMLHKPFNSEFSSGAVERAICILRDFCCCKKVPPFRPFSRISSKPVRQRNQPLDHSNPLVQVFQ